MATDNLAGTGKITAKGYAILKGSTKAVMGDRDKTLETRVGVSGGEVLHHDLG